MPGPVDAVILRLRSSRVEMGREDGVAPLNVSADGVSNTPDMRIKINVGAIPCVIVSGILSLRTNFPSVDGYARRSAQQSWR